MRWVGLDEGCIDNGIDHTQTQEIKGRSISYQYYMTRNVSHLVFIWRTTLRYLIENLLRRPISPMTKS